ncbi:MAG TPA: anthrax toxin-like adenylyl cyclase domain-containing protein [Acidobacteriaceae bacterium]|jgi:hypothetical protein
MACYGLQASFKHPENGMKLSDMTASFKVAERLNEVIIYRSTGPWSLRWIELGYPTKNFHVKGKSSDWGPQAGFVPFDGYYSKVGHNTNAAANGVSANMDGLGHKFAGTVQLTLTEKEIEIQRTRQAEQPARTAIDQVFPVAGTKDLILTATRSGDRKVHAFRAVFDEKKGAYAIEAFDDHQGTNPFMLLKKRGTPLMMMTSSEAGANNRPMTGDYDLMAICPTWASYMGRSEKEISKPGLNFTGKGVQPGLSFPAGSRMDMVMNMATNTGARPAGGNTKVTFQGKGKEAGAAEHPDMGNLTPRILRCINELNIEMGATGANSAMRRVHHNAESHRNNVYAALTSAEMEKGDGLPLTVFQPTALCSNPLTSRYTSISTLDTLTEFREYATRLNDAGYFVPRNWTWGMSLRDVANNKFGHVLQR